MGISKRVLIFLFKIFCCAYFGVKGGVSLLKSDSCGNVQSIKLIILGKS